VNPSVASESVETIVIPPANIAVAIRKITMTDLERVTIVSLSAVVALSIRLLSRLIAHRLELQHTMPSAGTPLGLVTHPNAGTV
jgi:hypothetical protein